MFIVLIRSVIIYISVILALRIMGKRQIGELTPHELVITILVSQVAVIPLEDNAMPLINMFIPMIVFVAFEILVSALSLKSMKVREIVQGKPIFVIKNGKIDEKQLVRLRLTIDDLADAIRQKDIFDLSTVQDAIVETNGTISVLQKAEESPVTPKQLSLSVEEVSSPVPIVIDGKIVNEYFSQNIIKNSEIKLIISSNNKQPKSLLLMTIDDNGNVFYYPKRDV